MAPSIPVVSKVLGLFVDLLGGCVSEDRTCLVVLMLANLFWGALSRYYCYYCQPMDDEKGCLAYRFRFGAFEAANELRDRSVQSLLLKGRSKL